MVCYPHLMSIVYAWGVAVPTGLRSVSVGCKLECIQLCIFKTTCSSFFFNQQSGACYLCERWLNNHLVTLSPPSDVNYFVIYPETCAFPGYQFIRGVGMCLKFSSQARNWTNAKHDCEMDEARLVKIDNEEKNTIIWTIINSDFPSITFWTGARDPDFTEAWQWTDGSPMVYTAWPGGEHTHSSSQNCLQLWAANGWDDNECHKVNQYICEKY